MRIEMADLCVMLGAKASQLLYKLTSDMATYDQKKATYHTGCYKGQARFLGCLKLFLLNTFILALLLRNIDLGLTCLWELPY